MKRKNATRSALFTSIISLLLCVSMLVGTTFAWFTDEVVSGRNVIAAGNLDVELFHSDKDNSGYVDSQTALFNDITLWEPGVVVYENFRVENVGNLALKYQLSINATPTGDFDLTDVLKVGVVEDGFTGGRAEAHALTNLVPLESFTLSGELEGNTTSKTYGIVIYWEPSANDNAYNMNNENKGKVLSIDLGVNLYATQEMYEEDSFGPDYDANLDAAASYVADEASLKAALEKGGKVVLMGDVTLSAESMNTTAASMPVALYITEDTVLDLNGHDIVLEDCGDESAAVIYTYNSELTIMGEGTVAYEGDSGFVIWARNTEDVENEAVVNIYDVTLYGEGKEVTMLYADCNIYGDGADFKNYATINVYGGEFIKNDQSSTNVQDYMNVKNHGAGRINLYGGTYNWNLTDMLSKLGDDKSYITVADGYQVVPSSDGTYTVLKGDVLVTDNAEFDAAINAGKTEIVLGSGNYIIPASAKGKTLTIIGNGEATVAVTKVGTGGENCDYGLDGSNVTFENVTITTNSSTYIGYARCNGTYNNCTFDGTYTLYGNSTFNNCTFNVSGDVYNLWTWGAPEATFTGCTFNSDGKALLLYGTADTKLTLNNCVFNDTGVLPDLKAAVEIGNDYGKSYELTVNNTTVNGYEINDKGICTNTTLWGNKNSMSSENLSVIVDGVTQVWDANGLAKALTSDAKNISAKLVNDIELPISSLGTITGGSGEYKLAGEATETITLDLNNNKLNITTTYWSAIGANNDNATITVKNGSMTSTGNSDGTWNA